MTWHSWLQHHLCWAPHPLTWSSPLPASTGTPQALRITPKHRVFRVAELQKEKQEAPESIPGGTLATEVSCEVYAKVALHFTRASRELAPRKALQEQNQIR